MIKYTALITAVAALLLFTSCGGSASAEEELKLLTETNFARGIASNGEVASSEESEEAAEPASVEEVAKGDVRPKAEAADEMKEPQAASEEEGDAKDDAAAYAEAYSEPKEKAKEKGKYPVADPLGEMTIEQAISNGMNVPLLRNGLQKTPGYSRVERQARTYTNTFLMEKFTDEKLVALTFDDGPHKERTGAVLDILKEEGVKATFFCIGRRMSWFPDTAKRIVAEGHTIGGHSYNHPDLKSYSIDKADREQVKKTEDKIFDVTGIRPSLWRPPRGRVSDEQILYFGEKGHKIILWTVDGFDWRYYKPGAKNVDAIAKSVLDNIHPGAVVCLHDIKQNTVLALPKIIKGLKERGYKMLTIDELFGFDPELES